MGPPNWIKMLQVIAAIVTLVAAVPGAMATIAYFARTYCAPPSIAPRA